MKKTSRREEILIFGGAGFIGSNWGRHLLKTPEVTVHVFDNLSRSGVRHNLKELQELAGESGRLKVTIGDIRDAAAVENAVGSASEVYHFAAQVAVTTSVADPRLDFSINVGGTFNILEAVRKSERRPFLLFTSTNKVYGELNFGGLQWAATRYKYSELETGVSEAQPLDFHSPYGCSKGAADQYVHDFARIFQIPTVVFRMSCIAGPRQFGNEDQGWVAHFLYSALLGNPVVIYGDGRQVRDVLCVHDLVRAFEAVRSNRDKTAGQVYNVGGGIENSISLLELMKEIKRFTGRDLEHTFCSMRPGDQLIYVTDCEKLRRDTGWRPRMALPETLEVMYAWWKEHRGLFEPERVQRMPIPLLGGISEVAA